MSAWEALVVHGRPAPQPRPQMVGLGAPCALCGKRPHQRVVSNAGKGGKRCRDWRENVRLTAIAQGVRLLPETPLELRILFLLKPPPSLLKKDRSLRGPARRAPTGARDGDIDNLFKSTVDALHGVLFDDDSWIVDGRARKAWALHSDPGAVIHWRPTPPTP